MLPDSGYIQENDIHWYNKKLVRQGKSPVEPIYDHRIASEALKNFVSISYERELMLEPGIFLTFTNTGHMLGSAVANLTIYQNGKPIKIAYTGDIGRKNPRILLAPCPFPQCDYLIMESTYGNRIHPNLHDGEEELLKIIQHTCVKKRGKLIIPSFSVGRTQEIIYSLNNFFIEKRLPNINIYVDSPLSVKATDIFRISRDCFNDDVLDLLDKDDDVFGFSKLKYIKDVNESKRLNRASEPCVIISASGMAEAGRVKHHIANSIDKQKNTILMVGYCTPTSLGARLQEDGLKEISIFGEIHKVKADIAKIETFSGQADYSEMLDFIDCQDKTKMKQIFLVHGEKNAQIFFKKKLMRAGFKNVIIPQKGTEYEI
jgi:metallo-beta-lactamase family protein